MATAPGADPTELRLLHVGRDVVQDGHGHDDAEDERPARDVPDGQGGVAESDRVAHRACDGAAQREHRRSGGHQDQTDHGDGQHQRPELPHGTPLLDFVHAVHGSSERPDVAGRRPHRTQQAEDQRHARGRGLDQLRDGVRSVSTAEDGPRSSTICRTASVVRCPCPNTPSKETSASSAGNSDRTA